MAACDISSTDVLVSHDDDSSIVYGTTGGGSCVIHDVKSVVFNRHVYISGAIHFMRIINRGVIMTETSRVIGSYQRDDGTFATTTWSITSTAIEIRNPAVCIYLPATIPSPLITCICLYIS